MMYPYISFPDETEICHSQILTDEAGEYVEVHFERPTEDGFLSARCRLPEYRWLFNDGFSQADIGQFETFLRSNAHLLFKYARSGGVFCA